MTEPAAPVARPALLRAPAAHAAANTAQDELGSAGRHETSQARAPVRSPAGARSDDVERLTLVASLRNRIAELEAALNSAHEELNSAHQRLHDVEQSTTWRATAVLRSALQHLPPPVRLLLRGIAKTGWCMLTPHRTLERLHLLRERRRAMLTPLVADAAEGQPRSFDEEYADWISRYDSLDDDDRKAIAVGLRGMANLPLISVIMPVYETPEPYLRGAIESVRQQLYPNWELCIADNASPSPHVRQVLEEFRRTDPRIKICYRSENGHISASSNSALGLAEGEFVALVDSDDILPEHALYVVAASITAQPDLDLIYSDEDKITIEGRRFEPYFKPDWSPDLLLSQNVFSHLGVYRRRLIEEVGGFRLGDEGSQDYDLVLRASTRTLPERILHLPYILYHWRAIPGSTAFDADAKPYALQAARKAIADHLAKFGLIADVLPSRHPAFNRVRAIITKSWPASRAFVSSTTMRHSTIRQLTTSLRHRRAARCYAYSTMTSR